LLALFYQPLLFCVDMFKFLFALQCPCCSRVFMVLELNLFPKSPRFGGVLSGLFLALDDRAGYPLVLRRWILPALGFASSGQKRCRPFRRGPPPNLATSSRVPGGR
jgi:hypothetical protein